MSILHDQPNHLYPTNWPKIPFHEGEVEVQNRLGVHDSVMTFGPRAIRPFFPDQHREFYTHQPFLVVAARDSRDKMWCTLLFGSSQFEPDSFIESPNPTHLTMKTKTLQGDALEGALQPGSDLGILGIEFATKRRNRVNGRIVSNNDDQGDTTIVFRVDQSFGNCPQYIKPRNWWTVERTSSSRQGNDTLNPSEVQAVIKQRPNRLTLEQMERVREAETIFLATGYRGSGEDYRFGNDASHRGGSAGFLKVSKDGKKIFLPDYAGNNMYNSLGNLAKDPRMGVTIPLFETGGMIQITGTATVHWEDSEVSIIGSEKVSISDFPGALRWLEFDVDEIVELPAESLPLRWDAGARRVQLQVHNKVEESEDVMSFYLAPLPGENLNWEHRAGQHLTLELHISCRGADATDSISRSYSISSFQSPKIQEDRFFRISVRRDPLGIGSTYLHDRIEMGDLLTVQKPSGDFYYPPKPKTEYQLQDRVALFLSAGVGVTPLLSMLHAFVGTDNIKERHQRAIWLHSGRNGRHHPFREEVELLTRKANQSDSNGIPTLQSFVAYTKPDLGDNPTSYNIEGRINFASLQEIFSQAQVQDMSKVDVFLCGPNGFVASMQDALNKLGVDNISYETF